MEQYEYINRYFGYHEMDLNFKIEPYLNEIGQKVWELVNIITKQGIDNPMEIVNYFFIFKRKLNKY